MHRSRRPRPGAPRRLTMLATAALSLAACRPATAPYVPRDAALRSAPVYIYPAAGTSGSPPRALVLFFGNDVGFWSAHQRTAELLAAHGMSVVGLDLRRYLAPLPTDEGARERTFAEGVLSLIAAARRELHAERSPLVLAGRSFGAEVALWTAAHACPPRLAGVLALGPGLRGHLRITAKDLANLGEPLEPGSFAVADALRSLPPAVRVAVVRGAHDHYGYADSALQTAGGARLRRLVVPSAGHSLKHLSLAGPAILGAADWILAGG
ncbi:MAG TPA: hypothetical protein VFS05_08215 [Gemmatimonadaceae bacterium]|nr:hypothetical protein [Gemmatimonadaceae bacterium]